MLFAYLLRQLFTTWHHYFEGIFQVYFLYQQGWRQSSYFAQGHRTAKSNTEKVQSNKKYVCLGGLPWNMGCLVEIFPQG